MKISHYPDIFLLVYTYLLLKITSMTGGGQPQNPISWNSSIYWWGATYPSWFTLPPPKILEQWLFTDNEMTLKYYIT